MLITRRRSALVLVLTTAFLVPFGTSSATALPEVPPGCWLAKSPIDDSQLVVVCPREDPGTPATPGGTTVRQPSEEELRHSRDIQNYCDLAEREDANRQLFGVPSGLANNAKYQSYCTPAGSTPGDAGTAARQVVAGMNLPAPTIGIAPTPTTVEPNSVGLVGVPNYMWVDNPEIFGTTTDTATLDSWTITVTATVEYVDWDMGDKQIIRCKGPGTPYQDRFDLDPSPDCGHVYTEQGYYTVTATAHWRVEWNSTDQTGTLTTDQTASVPIVIGEALALRRK